MKLQKKVPSNLAGEDSIKCDCKSTKIWEQLSVSLISLDYIQVKSHVIQTRQFRNRQLFTRTVYLSVFRNHRLMNFVDCAFRSGWCAKRTQGCILVRIECPYVQWRAIRVTCTWVCNRVTNGHERDELPSLCGLRVNMSSCSCGVVGS
jgi:hypothetical protein